jgi:C1A family cysteine protease
MESNFSNSFSRVAAFFFLLSVIFLTGCGGGGESKAVASSTSNTRSLGVIPLPQDQYLLIPKAPTPSFGTLPDFFDLTDKFPSPLNQGSQGSCVGWAVAYYKSYQEAIDHKWDVKTHFFSPSFVYNQLNRGVDNGTHIVDALDLLERSGLPLLADMPYDEKDYLTQPSPAIKRSALVHRSKNYGRVEYSDLRTQLAAGNPIVFSIAVFADLDQLNTGTYNDVYDVFGEGDSRGFHAMTIV